MWIWKALSVCGGCDGEAWEAEGLAASEAGKDHAESGRSISDLLADGEIDDGDEALQGAPDLFPLYISLWREESCRRSVRLLRRVCTRHLTSRKHGTGEGRAADR